MKIPTDHTYFFQSWNLKHTYIFVCLMSLHVIILWLGSDANWSSDWIRQAIGRLSKMLMGMGGGGVGGGGETCVPCNAYFLEAPGYTFF